MQQRILVLSMTLGVVLTACGTKAVTQSRELGDPCDEANQCADNLYCDSGICRAPCTNDKDCNDNESCKDGRCIYTGKTREKEKVECKEGFTGENCDECQEGHFGPYCLACPDCGSHGACLEGISGSGECKCDEGFSGALCNQCAPNHGGADCHLCPACVHGQVSEGSASPVQGGGYKC